MKKALRISGIVVASLLGLVLIVLAALPLVLNSRVVTNLVDKYAAEYIDGDLEYSRLHISLYKHFPRVGITLEDVALTYPHERFAPYDTVPAPSRLLEAGRGIQKDTLARFGSLEAAADVWKLLQGEIRVSRLALNRFAAFAHNYGDAANWDILRLPQSEKDSSGFDLPWIHLRELRIDGRPQVVYTAQRDDIYAAARFLQFALSGDAKLSSEQIRLRDVHLALDSLQVFGHIPQDTLAVRLDYLKVDERPLKQEFDLALAADALVRTQAFGRLTVPVALDGRVSYEQQPRRTDVGVDHLDLRVAQLPLHAEGRASLFPDSIELNAEAAIRDCPLDSLLRGYLDRFLQLSRDLSTDARLSATVSANGTYSKDSFPHVAARVQVPQSHSFYRPMDLGADLVLDIDAEMSPDKRIDARVRTLKAGIPGLKLQADGSADDLLGRNPRYSLHATANAGIGPLMRFVPASLGIREASGNARLDLRANVTQQELRTYQFQKSDVSGTLRSDSLHVVVPADSIDAKIYQTDILVGSNQAGLRLNANFDSLYLDKGVSLQARIRNMQNGAQVVKIPVEGQLVPRLFASTDNGEIFAKLGSSRVGVRDASIWLAAEQRVRRESDRRKRQLDSLQRLNPDVPRADLAAQLSLQRRNQPPRRHGDFADSDLSIALDSSYTRLLRQWSPSGSIEVASGFFASPRLPLRTRLTALSASFNDNEIDIDSVGVKSGSSDINAAGYVQGLRGALFRRGLLEAQLNVTSNRLNINELVAALQAGSQDIGAVAPEDEQDESFVTDTLENAEIDRDKMSLVVVPGNVKATLGVQADTVDYTSLQVGPVLTVARVQDRTAQLLGTHVISDIGRIGLDAYYSTQSKQDISAGIDLRLEDMKAHDIIQLLPSVDSLIPALKSFEGRLGCDLSATTQLDTNMNVIIPSLDGLLRITGRDLEVKDAGDLRRITRLLLFRNKNIGHIDDLTVDAVVHDSKLEVFPFELGVDRYRLALMGMQGFDKSMYYHVSILRSPFLIRFGINLFGSLDNWRFSLGRARYRSGRVPVYTQQLDSVQVNIATGIRDIFNTGVNKVRQYNDRHAPPVQVQEEELLSSEEYRQVDDLALQAELEDQNAELDEVVGDVLADATRETDKLMKTYAEQMYDKRILRKMERMNKKK